MFGDHDDGLGGELATTHVKEIFEGGAEEVDDEDVVEALLAKVVDCRHASWEDAGGERSEGWEVQC